MHRLFILLAPFLVVSGCAPPPFWRGNASPPAPSSSEPAVVDDASKAPIEPSQEVDPRLVAGCEQVCVHLRTLSGVQSANVDACESACVERATLRQIECLLKATSSEAVAVCPY